jgi:hypothetical protein
MYSEDYSLPKQWQQLWMKKKHSHFEGLSEQRREFNWLRQLRHL